MQLGEMQNEVNNFFKMLGVDHVSVDVCDDKNTRARASGVWINRILLPRILGLHINVAFGRVFVNLDYFNETLLREEQRFVLAHEVSHIYYNHVAASLPLKLFNAFLKTLAAEWAIAVDGLKLLLYARGIPPPISNLTKEQELGADIQAICLTMNETAAKSCLTKLVNDNLDKRSHSWEALGLKIPVMTMRERIEEIERRLAEISRDYRVNFL